MVPGLFNFPDFLHTQQTFPVKQREFVTRICGCNTICSEYCHYSNESIWIFQSTNPEIMYFLKRIWLIKCNIDNFLLSYIISCQDFTFPAHNVCACAGIKQAWPRVVPMMTRSSAKKTEAMLLEPRSTPNPEEFNSWPKLLIKREKSRGLRLHPEI